MDIRAQEFYANIANLYASTPLHPLALAVTLLMGIALLLVPKRFAVIPILVVMLSITELQRVVAFGFNFSMVRLLELFGWARVILRVETTGLRRTNLDSALLLFVFTRVVFHTLQARTFPALVNSLGIAFDAIGLYFLFRILLADFAGALVPVRALALLAIPVAVLMLIEQHTGRNLFSVFGGVPEYTYVRGGLLRSQAAFQHPILAGTFGATLLPMSIGLWKAGPGGKAVAITAILSCSIIALTSASSGPVFALLMGAAAVMMWPLAGSMRSVRWLALAGFAGVQLVMKSPIYALFARFPLFSGSTGYYRYVLIDAFLTHFRDWALLGVPSTAYWGPGLFDVTNQYIRIAVDGGLATLLAFIFMIAVAYRELGILIRASREGGDRRTAFFLWGLGCTLFAHLVSFLSVNYFDQIIVLWYVLLATIASLFQAAVAPRQVPLREAAVGA